MTSRASAHARACARFFSLVEPPKHQPAPNLSLSLALARFSLLQPHEHQRAPTETLITTYPSLRSRDQN